MHMTRLVCRDAEFAIRWLRAYQYHCTNLRCHRSPSRIRFPCFRSHLYYIAGDVTVDAVHNFPATKQLGLGRHIILRTLE